MTWENEEVPVLCSLLCSLPGGGPRAGMWEAFLRILTKLHMLDLIIHLEKAVEENCIPNMDKWIGDCACVCVCVCMSVYECVC